MRLPTKVTRPRRIFLPRGLCVQSSAPALSGCPSSRSAADESMPHFMTSSTIRLRTVGRGDVPLIFFFKKKVSYSKSLSSFNNKQANSKYNYICGARDVQRANKESDHTNKNYFLTHICMAWCRLSPTFSSALFTTTTTTWAWANPKRAPKRR